jgi:hypothetical protein
LGYFPRNLPLTFDRYNLSIAGVPVSLPFSQLTELPIFRRPLAEWELLFGYIPLHGWKGQLYDGGIRVPAFVTSPRRIPSGKTLALDKRTPGNGQFRKLAER